MKNICIVAPAILGPSTNGGIGAHCYYHAITLASNGYDVTVLLTSKEDRKDVNHWKKHFLEKKLKYEILDLNISYINEHLLDKSYKVFLFLKDNHFDEVHFQDWYSNGFVSIQAKNSGVYFQDTFFTMSALSSGEWVREGMQIFKKESNDFLRDYCERFSTKNVDLLITPTKHMKDWLQENNWDLPKNIQIIPFVCSEKLIQDEDLIKIDKSHICFYGRLETRKGLEIFVESLKILLLEETIISQISFLGKNATVKNGVDSLSYINRELSELLKNKNISVNIYNDFSADEAMQYLIDTGAIAIMPSLMDNLPYVILDCIQNKRPFLTSNIGGISEVVDSNSLFEINPYSLYLKLKDLENIKFNEFQHIYSNEVSELLWLNITENSKTKINHKIINNIPYKIVQLDCTNLIKNNECYYFDSLDSEYILLIDKYSTIINNDNSKIDKILNKNNNDTYVFYSVNNNGKVNESLGYINILSEISNTYGYGVILVKSSLIKDMALTLNEIESENIIHLILLKIRMISKKISIIPDILSKRCIDTRSKLFNNFEITNKLIKSLNCTNLDFSSIKNFLIRYYLVNEGNERNESLSADFRISNILSFARKNTNKLFVIYGYNGYGIKIYKEFILNDINIKCIIDMDEIKISNNKSGINVKSMKNFNYDEIDYYVVATDRHKESMQNTLIQNGVNSSKIKFY